MLSKTPFDIRKNYVNKIPRICKYQWIEGFKIEKCLLKAFKCKVRRVWNIINNVVDVELERLGLYPNPCNPLLCLSNIEREIEICKM